ncbi:MAG: CheR family methyltransferase [Marinobacter sp.]|uniref:CheR family methyltransferase n=1 Tax=Marinobacter sp. TaxID=50741 RepID=UPI003F994169
MTASTHARPLMVGVAASAGGLEALTHLLRHLDPSAPLSLIIAQHLSPDHESMLTTLLSRESKIPVESARNNTTIKVGHAYVIPPGHNAGVLNGLIRLEATAQHGVPKPSANELFVSLAEAYEGRSAGVVLSGTGSDGSQGCRVIKAHEGFTLAQVPSEAKYDGMPLSAIETACVDRVLPVKDIAKHLLRLAERKEPLEYTAPQAPQRQTLGRILDLLSKQSGVDFSEYKDNTLHRRVQRRMVATDTSSWFEYESFVQQNPEELQQLYQDMLISVTAFFRDGEAFEELAQTLQSIVDNKSKGDEIRIWVAGCATGEEAYSIAILLHETLGGAIFDYNIQIFATDIDMQALTLARRGRYESVSVKDLSKERISKYFTPTNDGCQVKKHLREMVVFARQNLVGDPAFLHVDLISCRNVLIYMKPDLQKQVQATFHYALRPGGLLFLGKSESLPGNELFEASSTDSRVFVRQNAVGTEVYRRYKPSNHSFKARESAVPPKNTGNTETLDDRVFRAISRHVMDKAFVIDEIMDIKFIYGDLNEITQISKGKASLNIQNIVHKNLQVELKSLLFKARKSKAVQKSRPIAHNEHLIYFEVVPLAENSDKDALYLVRYDVAELKEEAVAGGGEESEGRVEQLQLEVTGMREHLQTVIEELETSNEELQAVNEELQSANEELQSTNEELETSNEELQSTNEELTTVNEEVQFKVNEIADLNYDLKNLQRSLPHPLLALDKNLQIAHYNPAATDIFAFDDESVGKPVEQLSTKLDLPNLRLLIGRAFESQKPEFIQIKGEERYYQLSVNSYRNDEGQLNGVILLFWDNTELLKTYDSLEQALRDNSLQARAMEAAEQGIIIADAQTDDMPVLYVNRAFTEMSGYASQEARGLNCRFLQGPDTDPRAVGSIRRSIQAQTSCRELVLNYKKDGTPFWNRLSLAPVMSKGKLTHYIGIQSDVSDLVHRQKQMALAEAVFNNTHEKIAVFDDDRKLVFLNRAFSASLSVTTENEEFELERIFHPISPEITLEAIWRVAERTGKWRGELEFVHGDVVEPLYVSINRLYDELDRSVRWVFVCNDIAELKVREEKLHRLAMYDELTGLPNRAHLNVHLQDVVSRHERSGSRFGLLFLDIDKFKRINDSLGHAVGDAILKYFSKTLESLIREFDFFARISGDEFVVIMEELEEVEFAQKFAKRILESLKSPIEIAGERLFISSSIGIAIYPEDGEREDLLLRNADIAMYRAKQTGRAKFSLVDPKSSDELLEQLRIEYELRTTLQNGIENGLHLVFQPYFRNGNGGELLGVEALIRWDHPELGFLKPRPILRAAEIAHLQESLDRWVMLQTIEQRAKWVQQDEQMANLQISINIHPENLPKLHDPESKLHSVLENYENMEWLTLEVTEDALLDRTPELDKSLSYLDSKSIRLAIDDFGAGYSNFSYLTEIGYVSKVKLDAKLLEEIENNPDKREKTAALIHMLQSMGFETVAEGIETRDAQEVLNETSCSALQGFYLSKPVNESAVLAMSVVNHSDATA